MSIIDLRCAAVRRKRAALATKDIRKTRTGRGWFRRETADDCARDAALLLRCAPPVNAGGPLSACAGLVRRVAPVRQPQRELCPCRPHLLPHRDRRGRQEASPSLLRSRTPAPTRREPGRMEDWQSGAAKRRSSPAAQAAGPGPADARPLAARVVSARVRSTTTAPASPRRRCQGQKRKWRIGSDVSPAPADLLPPATLAAWPRLHRPYSYPDQRPSWAPSRRPRPVGQHRDRNRNRAAGDAGSRRYRQNNTAPRRSAETKATGGDHAPSPPRARALRPCRNGSE